MLERYEKIRYPSGPQRPTHPDRLATVARLFGVAAARPDQCRVLEIGASDGSNLIPMAHALPESTFLGVDLAAAAVERGRKEIESFGIGNISLVEMNLMDIGAEAGEFDYIIAHGVYSWVPLEVRDRLMQVIRERLAPRGIAYLSYNAYPGSYFAKPLRDLMISHAGRFEGEERQLEEARSLARFIATHMDTSNPLGVVMRNECVRVLEHDPAQLFHDELEPYYQPLSFRDFIGHVAGHGLTYLADAEYSETTLPKAAAEPRFQRWLEGADFITREEYADFMRLRRFRRSLLCRCEANPRKDVEVEALKGLFVSCPSRPVNTDPELAAGKEERFELESTAGKGTISTDAPIAKTALVELGANWPASVPFDELVRRIVQRLNGSAGEHISEGEAESGLRDLCLNLFAGGAVELSVRAPDFVMKATEKPLACPFARHRLESNARCVNHRHITVEMDEMSRRLIALLDGTRDRETLRRDFSEASGKDVEPENLEKVLAVIASSALLIA